MAVIAVAAYSYMALVPMIQPPIMKLLTTKKERLIKMKQLRVVSKTEKTLFPLLLLCLSILLLPPAAPLIGMLAFGNFVKQCGVVERLSKTMENELMNIVSILLSLGVGSQMTPEKIMNGNSLGIILLGLVAFSVATAGGLIMAKIMNLFLKEKINPLIGSAGVSAVPMAARVANKVGMDEDPSNFLLMHAMGPNVSGVIGTAVAAGVFIATYAR
jgi:oxaloacetate decarboxylase beta subunit